MTSCCLTHVNEVIWIVAIEFSLLGHERTHPSMLGKIVQGLVERCEVVHTRKEVDVRDGRASPILMFNRGEFWYVFVCEKVSIF